MDTVVNDPLTGDEVIDPNEPVVTETLPGTRTDPALLLKSLQTERQKRQDLEFKLQELTASTSEVISDEGRALLKQIEILNQKISSRDENDQLTNLQSKYAPLIDKSAEFEQYRIDNPGMRLETAAKAFLIDNDLLQTEQPRKGLERTTSTGGRTAPTQGWTLDKMDELRVSNYRKYAELLKSGAFHNLS